MTAGRVAGTDDPLRVGMLPDRLVVSHGDRLLYEYVFAADLARELSPRPYFHPLRTLAGVVVTDHQPADHRWHLGLAYSWPVVGGWSFWGGPTYVRDRGYVDLANQGTMRHVRWDGEHEELVWLDPAGARVATERRLLGRPVVDVDASVWWLELGTEIENASGRPLRFGSPTTEGRPLAGYAGLAWRGPDPLRDARVLLDDDRRVEDPMGERSRWLGYVGGGVTLGFFEHASNPGVPNRWFVRTREYPLVASSPVFDQALELAPGASLRMRHRLLVADGEWGAEQLAAAHVE